MEINQKRILMISVVILLLLLLLTQVILTKGLVKESKQLQSEIKKLKGQNRILEDKYQQDRKEKLLKINFTKAEDKENTAEILERLKSFKLKLLDFNHSSNQLNLNLTGEFNSILQFIKYLEEKMTGLEIVEFKIKSSGNELFLFLKLKNELI